jgi:hypothetical protein
MPRACAAQLVVSGMSASNSCHKLLQVSPLHHPPAAAGTAAVKGSCHCASATTMPIYLTWLLLPCSPLLHPPFAPPCQHTVCPGKPPTYLIDQNAVWPDDCNEQTAFREYCTAICVGGAQGTPSIMCGGAGGWSEDTFKGRCVKGPGESSSGQQGLGGMGGGRGGQQLQVHTGH